MSINSVTISGNLTRDCEMRVTAGGTSMMSFSVAVNDRKRNSQTGEWEDYANFVDCVLFGKRADYFGKVLHKGAKVFVSGKLRYESWERNGQRRSKLEVVADDIDVLSPKAQGGQQGGSYAPQNQQQGNYPNQWQHATQDASQQPTGYDEYFGGGAY